MRKLWRVLILAFVTVVLLHQHGDAAVTSTPVLVQTPKNGSCTFVQGTDSAGTYKTCYTGGTNGTKIVGIYATSNDTTPHVVTVQLSTSTTAHCSPQSNCLGGPGVSITGAANFNAVVPINFLSTGNWPGLPFDSDGNPYLYLTGNSQTIEATFQSNLGASTQVSVVVVAADF